MPVAADIYYHIYETSKGGLKPPVILIHGAGGSHLSWPHEVRRLPGYQVYAIDLPGHGKSSGRGLQSIPAFTDALLKWLEIVGVHSAIFIGHSMGGAIAISLALNHPHQVAGLVLLGSGSRLRVAPQLIENASNPTTLNNAFDLVLDWSFSPKASPRLRELVARRLADTRQSVFLDDFLACNAFDETARLCEIHQPVLVLCGAEDRMTPPRYSSYLASNIPNAQLLVIPDAGHMVMLEQPQVVAAALVAFLENISY